MNTRRRRRCANTRIWGFDCAVRSRLAVGAHGR